MKKIRSVDSVLHSKRLCLFLLAFCLLAAFLVSFALGHYDVSLRQVMGILCNAILGPLTGGRLMLPSAWTDTMQIAVLNIRLPRILMACMVGCCLSAAGAAYQGVFQNPMASPDVLGASSGAAFGAALAILLGASSRMVTLSAFAFSLATIVLVFLIARHAPGLRVVNLILAGVMISSLFSAGTSYCKLVADPSSQLPEITYWLLGSLSGTKITDVQLALPPMVLGCAVLLLIRWRLNLLTLGDEEAHALGVNTDLLRLGVILCATLITAASIAASGMIGWVGLVIPHLCRRLVGADHRFLMPASMITGAAFLLITDNVSRNLLAVEIPIGILTAFIGAPFFIYLILKQDASL